MLISGLYEQIINKEIHEEIRNLPKDLFDTRDIDKEEASQIISSYLTSIIKQGFDNIIDRRGSEISDQIKLANKIIDIVKQETECEEYKDYEIDSEAKQLLAILSENDPRLITKKKASDLPRPESSISQSSIFTGGAVKEPQLIYELQKEIETADSIDFLVSFIKWSGLVKILKELQEFTNSGKKLRVIATTYTGATDAKAIHELSQLPNTEIRISYDTKTTRLHAKAYIFHRNNGFSVAYIGSSNLTNPALTSGLEWNFKVASKDLPETWEKIVGSFDSYWNAPEFTEYTGADEEKLQKALKAEKHFSSDTDQTYIFDIHPYSYQQEILDKLDAERKIRERYQNLVVAATGTGKTIISAFDYKRFYKENSGKTNKLLFVAHREEILKQSRDAFRVVLRDPNFGELFVGDNRPNDIKHLFVSIQTLNSQQFWAKLPPDFYDFIVVDEFHHAAADSYQKLLQYFKPKILLGLTATPERMDGKTILSWFGDHIAAEIRLPEAIDRKLLSPFQYFGVSDNADLSRIHWVRGGYDRDQLSKLYTEDKHIADQRATLIIEKLKYYVSDISKVKGLGFCVSKDHAKYMSAFFNAYGIHSLCLTSETNRFERDNAKNQLVSGNIKFIFVVDLYNEGVDIPEVNTVLFLRPTESLTIFLQQLGRGLRLADDKDCLTVLDFIGIANSHYNFEEKFQAIASDTRQSVLYQVQHGFPYVPKGCFIQLEKKASQIILDNIKKHFKGKTSIISRITTFENDTGLELNLQNFLDYYHLDSRSIYRDFSFKRLCADAGVIENFTEPVESKLTSGFSRLVSIDSRRWIDFLLNRFLPRCESHEDPFTGWTSNELRMIHMFYVSVWNEIIKDWNADQVFENIYNLIDSPNMLAELREILTYNLDHLDFIDEPLTLGFDCPMDLHCSYTRDQILTALDCLVPVREGVKYLPEKKTDILFVTLNKSIKEYSPSTLYKDYSINETLFHWQSQSTTSETGSTGQRYINHDKLKSNVLLFVREFKSDEFGITSAYTCLGKVHFRESHGSSPMNIIWELERPIPVKYLKKTNKLLIN